MDTLTSNGIDCLECGALTPGGTEADGCPACGDFITQPVHIEKCPNGVTVADWHDGSGREKCTSDVHEWKSGLHITPVEE